MYMKTRNFSGFKHLKIAMIDYLSSYDFILFVTDNDGVLGGTGDRVTVTIIATAENQPPISRAGANQTVESRASVTLDGSLSSDDGTITSYQWIHVLAGQPALTNGNTARPTFTAPTLAAGADNVTLSYALIVTDNDDLSTFGNANDTVEITVTPPAVPTDTTAPTGTFETAPATHDGKTPIDLAIVFSEPVTGFMFDHVVRSPQDLPPGIEANNVRPTISNFRQDSTNALRYTFTVTPIAPYDFEARISPNGFTDEAGNQNARILGPLIAYEAPNAPPISNAGPDQTVVSGATVELDGSGSTDDGTITNYQWVHAAAGQPALTNGNTARPTFTAPVVAPGAANVILTYGLRVTDDDAVTSTVTDTVMITVTPPADTTAPTGTFETAPTTHDGMTPINLAVVFSEPVTGFTESGLGGRGLFLVYPPPGTAQNDVRPMLSNVMQDSTNELRYTFTLTPIAPYDIFVRVQRNRLTDEAGNQNAQIDGPYIIYVVSARKPPANFRLSRYSR